MRIILLLSILVSIGCQKDQVEQMPDPPTAPARFLALGDSYTIGQNVADSLRWPNLLVDSLETMGIRLEKPTIVARTGWRSDELLQFTDTISHKDWDLVTLLIGVNDFYQNIPWQTFEPKFREMLDTAISFADRRKSHVLVVSIPDYGYTPFGQFDLARISAGIDDYNAVVSSVCNEEGVAFISITDISRRGLAEPELVANDGLHPSGLQYALWVERMQELSFFKQFE